VKSFEVTPDAGLPYASQADLKAAIRDQRRGPDAVMDGHNGAYRDIVLFNSAAALLIAGKAKDLKEGAAQAGDAIDPAGAAGAPEADCHVDQWKSRAVSDV
jgi:anthranilate phosphoribosyltransferase